jgi:2-hydroxy-6-oxonona-2,4-dienedioate hydrolase/2-succinyl-6-hydroxy-2,4-cyclohexadiene-1-carboxylate synthase
MPKALVNGVHLHYQQLGRGPNVVMVHGITGNQAIWHLEILPALMQDYRLTTYDLRGHGYSDMPPTGYTTADHALDLNHLLDSLGIERTHVVGHSFGADISLHYAILYPEWVDRLVLVEPAVAALEFLRDTEDWVGWKYWRDKLSLGGVFIPPEKWYDCEYLVRASVKLPKLWGFRKGQARRSAPLIKLMESTTVARDFSDPAGMTLEKISDVRRPTLLVYGTESVFLGTCEYLTKHLPNCTQLLIPESEHFGPLEQPEILIKHLRAFLESSWSVSTAAGNSTASALKIQIAR